MASIKQLQTFIKVLQHKSFTSAAQELYITQPAVTNQIRLLEEEYGMDLVDRSGRELIPTASGKLLLEYAQEILDIYQKSKSEIDQLNELMRGNLVVGASTGPGEHILPKIMGEFKSNYPQVHVELNIAKTEEVISQVKNRTLEIGIVGAVEREEFLKFEPFIKDEIILICSPENHLAEKSKIEFKEILEEPFIIQQKGAGIRIMFEKALKERRIKIDDMNIYMELGLQESIKSAVAENFGVGIISRYAVQRELDSGNLLELEVKDWPQIRSEFYMVKSVSRKLSKATEEFLYFSQKYIQKNSV